MPLNTHFYRENQNKLLNFGVQYFQTNRRAATAKPQYFLCRLKLKLQEGFTKNGHTDNKRKSRRKMSFFDAGTKFDWFLAYVLLPSGCLIRVKISATD